MWLRKSVVLRAVFVLCTLLLGIVGAGASYPPNTKIPPGFGGRHVMLGDLPVRVLQEGSGRDLLFIHGCPGSVEDFRPLMRELSGSFRVTAFDRPGHGFSGDGGQHSYRYHAKIALDLIEKLGLRHTIVVGHSFGGTTALAVALQARANVDGFVVIDSATYTGSRPVTPIVRIASLPWFGPGILRLLPSSIAEDKYREGLAEQFTGHPPSDEFVDLRVRIWSTPKVAHATALETVGANGWLDELSPHYREIVRPLFILAQAGNEFRRGAAQRVHAAVKGARLRLVPDAGHYIQFDQPGAMVEAIRTIDQATFAAR